MKLSNETVSVLKNFSDINSGLKFRQGNKISTVSPSKTILAEATVSEDFPQDFCVYDLTQFLSVLNLYPDADLTVDSVNVTFNSGRRKTQYRVTAENQIVTPPNKVLSLPTIDVEFTLSEDDLAWLLKTASILQSPNVAVYSDGESASVVTFNAIDDSASTNSIDLEFKPLTSFKMVFKTENLKLIPGAYEVQISKAGIALFKNTKLDIQYWIAIEANASKFGE